MIYARSSLILSSLASGAYSLVARHSECSFTLSTGGSFTGQVGQYNSGQAKAGIAGTSVIPSGFVLNGETISDSKGHGCRWTPPSTVLQCDAGQVPGGGFSIGCNGELMYNGQSTFWQCATEEAGVVMIYLSPGGGNCGQITLKASGCYPSSCGPRSSGSGTAPGQTGTTAPGTSSTYPSESGTAPHGGSSTYPGETGTAPGASSTYPSRSGTASTYPGVTGTSETAPYGETGTTRSGVSTYPGATETTRSGETGATSTGETGAYPTGETSTSPTGRTGTTAPGTSSTTAPGGSMPSSECPGTRGGSCVPSTVTVYVTAPNTPSIVTVTECPGQTGPPRGTTGVPPVSPPPETTPRTTGGTSPVTYSTTGGTPTTTTPVETGPTTSPPGTSTSYTTIVVTTSTTSPRTTGSTMPGESSSSTYPGTPTTSETTGVPSTTPGVPVTTTGHPTTSTGYSSTTPKVPGTSTMSSSPTSSTTPGESRSTSYPGVPTTSSEATGAPSTTPGVPGTTTGHPTTSETTPGVPGTTTRATSAPGETTGHPTTSTEVPTTSSERPTVPTTSTAVPSTTTEVPGVSTTRPSGESSIPGYPTSPPPKQSSPPGYPTAPPPGQPSPPGPPIAPPSKEWSASGYPANPPPKLNIEVPPPQYMSSGQVPPGSTPPGPPNNAGGYPNGPGKGWDNVYESSKEKDSGASRIPRRATGHAGIRSNSIVCPGELTGQWEAPSLIVPVDSANPNKAYGASTSGKVSTTISSVFKFNVPPGDHEKMCTLVFLFPKRQNDSESESHISGSGALEFSRLDGHVGLDTTQNNLPDVARSYRRLTVAPDNAYTIESFACSGGEDVVELSSVPGTQTELRFSQDSGFDACPLGLYMLMSTARDAEL
ncbi:ubiquitin 3 binding protein But2 C-terminal domain-containing protein [Hypoxylon sp. FL0890]|nr:ubiquitin 3 binding protein But2 C-terminal domain-containing protein [Hypoxylon sp. FL0890]